MYCGLENNYNIKLNELKNCLCGEHLDLENIFKKIDRLYKYRDIKKYSYLNSLLYPEKARGCKIPSKVPVCSCSFQLRSSFNIYINETGCLCCLINPFFLANTENEGKFYDDVYTNGFFVGPELGTFWDAGGVLVDNEITYPMQDWYPYPFEIQQVIPPVYSEYRLVSASLKIKYTGTLKEVSGTIGCGIWTSSFPFIGARIRARQSPIEVYNPGSDVIRTGAFADDITIDAIRHCQYFTENPLLEGIRALYFPIDNSYLEYVKICDRDSFSVDYFQATDSQTYEGKRAVLSLDDSKFKSGFNWVFFVEGGPKNKVCLRAELVCNFECLPAPEAMQYMPITNDNILDLGEDMNLAINSVRNKPITACC